MLYKPLSISASAAKLLGGFTASEAFDHSPCFGRRKYIFNVLAENISKVYDPVAVEAAGNDSAVCEYAELVL